MSPNRLSKQGAALVITLAFVVMITILVVALMENMRMDRPAASSYFERMRANEYAQAGVERVIATLGQFTSGTTSYWTSQPGQLVVSTTAGALQTAVPLHSGSVSVATNSGGHLNLPTLRDPSSNLIVNGTNSMPVQWIQVLKDGTPDRVLQRDPASASSGYSWVANPSFSPTASNPISGRYAYWADDESSKINYNTAWGRKTGNTNPVGSPTQIDLTALTGLGDTQITGSMADKIHSYITNDPGYNSLTRGFFNTPDDIRQVDAITSGLGVATALEPYKSSVTHYNHDPNTNFFNQPRIVLTTRPDRAGWTYKSGTWVGTNGLPYPDGTPHYLRILANEGTTVQPAVIPAAGSSLDPGLISKLDKTKVSATIADIVAQLQRTDWPMSNGSSFLSKYYPVGTITYPYAYQYPAGTKTYPRLVDSAARLNQLAINIIDYVRSKESPQTIVEPIRATLDSNVAVVLDSGAADPNAFLGITRAPMITEMGAWTDGISVNKLKVEVYLPPNYGIPQVDLTTLSLFISAVKVSYASTINVAKIRADQIDTGQFLSAGNYAVITGTLAVSDGATLPSLVSMRGALVVTSDAQRIDVAPLYMSTYMEKELSIIPNVPETNMPSVEVDDPRLNRHQLSWKKCTSTSGANTFGRPNSISTSGILPSSVSPQPQQDTDQDGRITADSLYMPPPAGQTYQPPNGRPLEDNTRGIVLSTGELGYVCTGVECSGTLAYSGTPWRTLRLQPNNELASVVPDWALLDLFTVPITTSTNAAPLFTPHGTSYAGRINLNSHGTPFDLDRTQPLAAALLGVRPSSLSSGTLSLPDAQRLASNIHKKNKANNGKLYSYPGAYYSAGEVVEIDGVASDGEASEQIVREIDNLLTARGNVFTVYTIGQSLKTKPNGSLLVTGEQRLQVMVERYVDNSTTPPSVRFAPVYYRNLTP